jgi:hypothetical protein
MPAYYADPTKLPTSSWLTRSQEEVEAPRPPVRRSLTPNNYPVPNSLPRPSLRSMNSKRMNFGPVSPRPGNATRRKHRKHRKATRKYRR